jgi:hypothetical protein
MIGLDWIGLGFNGYSTVYLSFRAAVIAYTQDLGLVCLIRKTGQPEKLISEKSLAYESVRTRDYKICSLTP